MNPSSKSKTLALVGPLSTVVGILPFPQIAVDGGIRFAHQPIFWVGDGDSGSPVSGVPAIHKPNQEQTDLGFCLEHIQDWEWSELQLFGFLGGRKDHEWANFGEVLHSLKQRSGAHALFHDQEGRVKVSLHPAGPHRLTLNGLFSVLAFESGKMSIAGACRFEMPQQEIRAFSGKGISNLANGEVHIQSSVPFMVVREAE